MSEGEDTLKCYIFETKDILLLLILAIILNIIISVTGLPRRGFATRDPAKEAERVASQVAKGRDLVKSTPTSFLTLGDSGTLYIIV